MIAAEGGPGQRGPVADARVAQRRQRLPLVLQAAVVRRLARDLDHPPRRPFVRAEDEEHGLARGVLGGRGEAYPTPREVDTGAGGDRAEVRRWPGVRDAEQAAPLAALLAMREAAGGAPQTRAAAALASCRGTEERDGPLVVERRGASHLAGPGRQPQRLPGPAGGRRGVHEHVRRARDHGSGEPVAGRARCENGEVGGEQESVVRGVEHLDVRGRERRDAPLGRRAPARRARHPHASAQAPKRQQRGGAREPQADHDVELERG